MKRFALFSFLLFLGLAIRGAAPAPPKGWEFLSTTDIAAKAFIESHPQWDGRGVLIAVCDSGVELATPGILVTSDGKPKVLDARVFCDEGKVTLEKAERGKDEHGEALHGKDGKWLYGWNAGATKPGAGQALYIGYLKEEDFKNSEANGGDLNHNGRSDDTFGLVVFKAGESWSALLDTNGNGSLSDEEPIADFAVSKKPFQLRGRDLHAQSAIMAFALNLWMDGEEKKAALYMADGSHGTHVSGICAGYSIDGQAGFNGIAPGAQILALKIGSNILSGGATTPGSMVSAWRYAVKRAKELDMPLVIQMSYGIGSEMEGKAVAEKLLDEILDENPGVVAAVSAGNEGPGLSTVGLPACANNVLAIGAVLNRTTAKDLYGANLTQDEMFAFSNRGGEMAKPEVVAPGFAASTVPVYSEGKNVMRGTSMASPQVSGALALLYSAALSSKVAVRGDFARAALMRGAVPIPGYGPMDQGHGLVNVPRAWAAYQALAARKASQPALYGVETESPEMADRKGPAIFWRGDYFPDGAKTQEITVRARFPKNASADFKAAFFQAFDIACDAPWLTVERGSAYIKAEQPARIPVRFDKRALSKPGLYQTTLRGYAKEGGRDLGPEWTCPVAVVVPERFEDHRQFRFDRDLPGIGPAKLERMFFLVDGRTGSVNLDVRLAPGEKGAAMVYLFDPEGRQVVSTPLRPGRDRLTRAMAFSDLEPGVWELDLYANYLNANPAGVKVSIQGLPLVRPLAEKATFKLGQGLTPSSTIQVISGLNSALRGEGKGTVTGSVTEKDHKLKDASWSKTFSVAPGESGVSFALSLSPTDYNKFTDIAAQILDADGKALISDGMGSRKASLDFEAPKGAKSEAMYTLKVIAATADPDDDAPSWTLHLREIHSYAEPIAVSVKQGKEGPLVLYPERAQDLTLQLKAVPPALPEGAAWLADVTLKDAEREGLVLPIQLKLEPGK